MCIIVLSSRIIIVQAFNITRKAHADQRSIRRDESEDYQDKMNTEYGIQNSIQGRDSVYRALRRAFILLLIFLIYIHIPILVCIRPPY